MAAHGIDWRIPPRLLPVPLYWTVQARSGPPWVWIVDAPDLAATQPPSPLRNLLTRTCATLAIGALTIVPPLEGQSAQEILQTALERNDSRTESVYNYTVVHEFLGFVSESYFERTDVDGRWVFAPRITATDLGGSRVRQEGANHLGISAWSDPFGHLSRWSNAATSEGTETVGGVLNWVVRIDDFTGSEWGLTPGTYADGVFQPQIGRLYLDTRTYLVNRFDVSGTFLQQDGVARPVRIVADLTDYRTIDGLTHPFALDLEIFGIGVQSDEGAAAAALLEELQRQLESLGDEDRATVQSQVDAQLALYEARLAGATPLTLSARVREIRVNEGPLGR